MDLDGLLEGLPPRVQRVARELVGIVREEAPGARERIDRRGVSFRHGPPGARAFVIVWPVKGRVRLLFPQGHRLEDPDRWLEGGGATRSLALGDVGVVGEERVRDWVRQAASHGERRARIHLDGL